MSQEFIVAIEEHFSSLPDPRRTTANQRHKFIDVLVIAICGAICGADGWTAIEQFGKAKEDWLRSFLELPSVLPSHDTFTDIFAKHIEQTV
jgi:H+/Cl- antiporter ClcA